MKYCLIFLFVFVFLNPAHANETLKCHYDENRPGGGFYSIELELILSQDHVTGLVYTGSISNGVEGQAYSCNLDTGNLEFLSSWTEKGPITVLTITQPDRTDSVQIEKKDKGLEVRFVDVGRYYCGFGAEFPAAVTLIPGEEFCKVQTD